MSNKVKKIAIIGAGFVGSTTAFTLMVQGIAEDIVLIDANHQKAEGEAMDLAHGMPFVKPAHVSAGEYSHCEGADVVVIAAGANQKPGETRMDLVHKNVGIFKQIIPEILKYNKEPLLLVVTNPVDILTYVTYKISGLPRERVLGSGTVLDTARFRSLIANKVGIDPRNIHGYVLGEHGDTEVAPTSITYIAGTTFEEYSDVLNEHELKMIAEDVKNAAYQIIERKGATYYAVALAVARIVEAIVCDENSILTVSSFMEGENGFQDICFSLPTVIGLEGRKRILNVSLSAAEYQQLTRSAEALKSVIQQINI